MPAPPWGGEGNGGEEVLEVKVMKRARRPSAMEEGETGTLGWVGLHPLNLPRLKS